MSQPFEFTPFTKAKAWTGRYARIPGREPAFHVSIDGIITAQWTDHDEIERLTAPIRDTPAAKALAAALNKTKAEHAGHAGGSFLINEFGQVVCPIARSMERFWVGNVAGIPDFKHPATGRFFTLDADPGLQPGQPWRKPYIGMKFNLDCEDRIRFTREDDDRRTRIWLPGKTPLLVAALRRIRPGGKTIRFIVNLHGVVLTKVENGDGEWVPVFVGHIDPKHWFSKEG